MSGGGTESQRPHFRRADGAGDLSCEEAKGFIVDMMCGMLTVALTEQVEEHVRRCEYCSMRREMFTLAAKFASALDRDSNVGEERSLE
ncbi:MAG: hypothetical protein DWQ45_16770 [Planctomycetota bacterium]|nr:MAG: hypothetical protein DWQ45_16770 [Planctomycetota bacterium]